MGTNLELLKAAQTYTNNVLNTELFRDDIVFPDSEFMDLLIQALES